MDPADLLASRQIRDRPRDPHHAVEAAGGEAHRFGGLGEEAAAGLVGAGDFLETLAVHFGVGSDPLPFEATGLKGPGRPYPSSDCQPQKSAGPRSAFGEFPTAS